MGGGRGKSKSKSKSKKKKTYTKAQKMAKARIAAKKTAPKTTKTKSTPASTGRAPSKTPTKAQQIAKARIASGKTISQVKAANKKSMQDAARKRNQTFQAKKAADAANRKLKAQGGTSAQVAKDNKRYGNTFPSGAIGISEAGKQQAAANRVEAAAKRTAPKGAFNISDDGRKQAEANKAAAAAKAQEEAKSAAESRRLAAENARRIAAERAAAKAEADRVAAAKKAAEKAAAERARAQAAERARAQAAERARVEAARKAEAERKRKAEIARKAEEKRQRQFDPRRLLGQEFRSSGDLRNPLNASNYLAAAGAGYTDSVIGGANFVKNLVPGVKNLPNIPTLPKYADKNLQRVRDIASIGIPAGQLTSGLSNLGKLNAARQGLSIKNVQAGFTGMGKTGFDAIRGGAKYKPSNKLQVLGKGAYSAPTRVGAERYAGATGSLGGKQTPGGVLGTIVPGGAKRIGFIEAQAKVPAATFDKGLRLADRVQMGAFPKSALANKLRGQFTTGVAPGGGIGTGGLAATSAVVGSAATAAKATQAGGLNIGGGVDSGEASSKTGRTLTARAKRPGFDTVLGAADFALNDRTDLDRMGKGLFGKGLVMPSDVVKDAGMVAGKIRNNELSIGDVKSGYRDVKNIVTSKDRLKTIGDMDTKDLTRLATKGYDVARDSAVVQTAGEKLGLPSDFKQQTDTLRNELKDRLSSVKIGDRDSTYKAISDFNRDIGTDPNLSLAARQVEAFRSGEGTTMQKIAAGFQPGAAKVKGLSAAERGVVGSLGNRIISGKQTDIAREAMSGMKAGSSLTAGNLTSIAQNVIKNTAPGADTVSAKRASQIKSLVTGGRGRRDVTPGSLLRGVNPFRGSNRGGGVTTTTTPRFQSVGGGGGRGTPVGQVPQIPATTTATATPVPQFQVPEQPEFLTQQGTDAGNLANIQNESYQNTFRNLMAINPNYMARFQLRRRRGNRRGGFRKAFSRRFFS